VTKGRFFIKLEDANLLLLSLSPGYRESLLTRLQPVSLSRGSVLYSPDEEPEFAHFLVSGIASIVSSMSSGASAEVGIWGREGLVQSFHLLGKSRIPHTCFIQIDATALVMPYRALLKEFETHEEMRRQVLQCVQSQGFIVGQLAACNRLHMADQRLARWLLMVNSRVKTPFYRLTQEVLATMLGTRRTTVTAAAQELQRKGLIDYSRGNIRVLDVRGLEHAACECYEVVQRLYSNFYGAATAMSR
jgi:CRP-like cAMP-binding protein